VGFIGFFKWAFFEKTWVGFFWSGPITSTLIKPRNRTSTTISLGSRIVC